MKKIVIALALSLSAYILQASPSWTVNESLFSNSMTITGIVDIAGIELTSTNDILGAFVGTECRGVAHLLPSTILGHSYAYLVINSNEKTESILFKVFQSSTGNIVSLANTYTFVSDASIGSQEKPYIFSDKSINGSAIEKISFGITDETVTIDNTTKAITVIFPQGTNLSTINTTSSISQGSFATINGVELTDTTSLDLSKPITITVTSQDGTISNWTVTAGIKTGISDLENNYDIKISPHGILQLVGFPETALCSVYSLSGQTIVGNIESNELINLSSYSNIPLVIVIKNQQKFLFTKLIVAN